MNDLSDIKLLNRAPSGVAETILSQIRATELYWEDIALVARKRFDTTAGHAQASLEIAKLSATTQKPVLCIVSESHHEVLVFLGSSEEVLKSLEVVSNKLWLARRLAQLEGR